MGRIHQNVSLPGLALVALVAWVVPLTTLGGTIYVDAANTSGMQDGTPEFPYNTIQQGIDNATSGDKVQVAPGLYHERILMRDGVSVLGSGPERTTISGSGISNSVVTFDGTRLSPLFAGFTITDGMGDRRSDIGGEPVTTGGGILIIDSSPVIRDNVVTGNVLNEGFCLGGGIYVNAIVATPQIVDNVISGNIALSLTVEGSGKGGGIYVEAKNGGAIISGNRIESNLAVEGAGTYIENIVAGAVDLSRNTIESNVALAGAGLFLIDSDGSTPVVNNVFRANGTSQAGGIGGGVLARAVGTGSIFIANNTFVGQNVSQGSGGALTLDDSSATNSDSVVANNVFLDNAAATGGGIDYTDYSGLIRRNDFHDNTGGDLFSAGGNGATMIDNLFLDPRLVLTSNNTYHLEPTSPLIDQAYESAAPAEDAERLARPFDGDGDGTPQSDVGAFEYPAGEVLGLLFQDATVLDWQDLPFLESYNIYRGSLRRLRISGDYTQDPLFEPMAAQFCDFPASNLPFSDPYVPAPGKTAFYLVAMAIGDYEGRLGENSSGLPRSNTNPCGS